MYLSRQEARLTRKRQYRMIHCREFLSKSRMWLSNTCRPRCNTTQICTDN